MRKIKLIALVFVVTTIAGCCHTRKAQKETVVVSEEVVSVEEVAAEENPVIAGNNLGYVSHQFRITGCNTVIVIPTNDDTSYIIPYPSLAEEFNIDGQYYYFNYRPLKVANPDGCFQGIPAEVYDLSPLMK